MNDIYIDYSNIIKSNDKNRGVFAGRNFREDEIIEECNLIIIDKGKDVQKIKETYPLCHYYYEWDTETKEEGAAIVLGYGSLYNHSYEPNAYYFRNYEKKIITYIALRDIVKGEEILINYNGFPEVKTPITSFTVDRHNDKDKNERY
jgi:uncharacterized protein